MSTIPTEGFVPLDASSPQLGNPGSSALLLMSDAGSRPPRVPSLLQNPKNRAILDLVSAERWSDAASSLVATVPLSSEDEACRIHYLAGVYWQRAGDLRAAEQFSQVPSTCPLYPLTKLKRAQEALRQQKPKEAITEAEQVAFDAAVREDADLVKADALYAQNDVRGAAVIYDEWLRNHKEGPNWPDLAIRAADSSKVDQIKRVLIRWPGSQAAVQAAGLLKTWKETLSVAERGDRVANLVRDGIDGAAKAEKKLLVSEPATPESKLALCKVAYAEAEKVPKGKKSESFDAWQSAITACEGQELQAQALFNGAKSAVAYARLTEAGTWYQAIESKFPQHRLADDARFRLALMDKEAGRELQAMERFGSIAAAYPSGDMGAEGLFRVALAHMAKGEWQEALPALVRIDEIAPADRHWATAGRATYFRAQSLAATGNAAEAKKHFARVVTEHPLAFYMLQSFSELKQIDSPFAEQTLREALLRDANSVRPAPSEVVLFGKAFERALWLLAVNEPDEAKREFARAAATTENAPPAVVWEVANAYNQAGLWDVGHGFGRSKLTEHLSHYPVGPWRMPWEATFPLAFESEVKAASERQSVPRSLIMGIMREESAFHPAIVSSARAVGLMQLIVPTATIVAKGTEYPFDESSLKKPTVSVGLGSKLLAELIRNAPHAAFAIAAYNAGSGAVRRWLDGRLPNQFDLAVELVPYEETRNYIKRVMSSTATYSFLYDPATVPSCLVLGRKVRP